jgi:hypothetical protein
VYILQRLLIAMRNDWVEILAGNELRPSLIAVRAGGDAGGTAAHLEMRLRGWDDDSPWSDLLHAYEESILAGDELNRQEMYRSLMKVMPKRNLDDGRIAKAADIYKAFFKVRNEEIPRLQALLDQDPPLSPDHWLQVSGLRDFWKDTVESAWRMAIPGQPGRGNTLQALDNA